MIPELFRTHSFIIIRVVCISYVHFFFTYLFLLIVLLKSHPKRFSAALKLSKSSGNFLLSIYSLYNQGSPTAKTKPFPYWDAAINTLPLCFKTERAFLLSLIVRISLRYIFLTSLKMG